MGTRFVTTYECDAPDDYKQTYIDAKEEDIVTDFGLPQAACSLRQSRPFFYEICNNKTSRNTRIHDAARLLPSSVN